MNNLLILCFFIMSILSSYSQQVYSCGTSDVSYPIPVKSKVKPLSNNSTKSTIYSIPVVFHVLYSPSQPNTNISAIQIDSALAILNRDFQKLNADVNDVQPEFQGIQGDAQIEFLLAHIAPDGSSFNGITRTPYDFTSGSNTEAEFIIAMFDGNDVYQGSWSYENYLNIFVVNNLYAPGFGAYTYLPCNQVPSLAKNSVYIIHSWVGNVGTGSNSSSRFLTHEVGHWVGVPHLWGNPGDCAHDDGIDDTPNTVGPSNNPPGGGQTWCVGAVNCGELSNNENFMEYTACNYMFTHGQVERMHAVLNSPDCGRDIIWSEENLENTGAFLNTNELNSKVHIDVSLYPNPNSGDFVIQFQSANNQNYDIIIHDSSGNKVFQKNYTIDQQTQEIHLALNTLASGIYTATLLSDSSIARIQFVKYD